MAYPNVLFKHNSPIQFKGGEFKDVEVTVEPNAAGEGTLKLFLTAPTCNFHNGRKEITQPFEANNAGDSLDMTINLSIHCVRPQIYTIVLNAEATNSEGNEGNDKIVAKVNNRP